MLFFREKSAISFMADLAGSQATFQIPEKINLEIQQWFGKVREKADQSQVQLRTDIVVSSKPVTRAIVALRRCRSFRFDYCWYDRKLQS